MDNKVEKKEKDAWNQSNNELIYYAVYYYTQIYYFIASDRDAMTS